MQISRTWTGTARRTICRIETHHPEYGWLDRGTIRLAAPVNGRRPWIIQDPDRYDATHLGDYLDAEHALLAMTPDLGTPEPRPLYAPTLTPQQVADITSTNPDCIAAQQRLRAVLRPLRPGEPTVQESLRASAHRHARQILTR